MACQINRNRKGEIESVLKPDGSQSALFSKVSSHPLIQNSEEALGVYMGVYTEKIGGQEEAVTFVNKTGGQVYNSYKDALQNSEENQQIEVGFEVEGKFFPVIQTEKNTNKNTQTGFINKSILDNKIKDSKKRVGNSYKFEAAGETEAFQAINTEIIYDEALTYLGSGGVGKDGRTFDLVKTNDKVRLRGANGEVQYISSEYFNTENFEKIKKDWGVEVAVGAIVGREWMTHLNNNKERVVTDGPKRTERQLQLLLMRMLENMGVKTMSIVEYTENYKKRKGVEPSAKALADIANQVIALRDGTIDTETLLEETAHFINEAMPQEQVENLLRNIHKTEEWSEFSEQYKAVYAREYQTEEEIDEAVRREILGKVLANSLRTSFEITPETSESRTNIIEYLREALNSFLNRVNNFFTQEFQKDLNSYTEQVEDMLFDQTLGTQMDLAQFKNNKFRLYELDDTKVNEAKDRAVEKIRKNSILMINTIRGQIHRAYQAEGTSTAIDKTELNRLEEQLDTESFKNSIGGLIKLTKNYLRRMEAALEKDTKTPFSSEQRTIFHTLKDTLSPALLEMNQLTRQAGIGEKDANMLTKDIKEISSRVEDLGSKKALHTSTAIMELTERVMQRHRMPEEYRDHVKKWIDLAETDTTFFHANFGQITHSRDPLLGLMGVIAKDMAMEENQASVLTINEALNQLKALGYDHRTVSQFLDKDSGTIISAVDFKAYQDKLDEVYLENIKSKNSADPDFFKKTDIKGVKSEMTNEDILESKQNLESRMKQDDLVDMRADISKETQQYKERAMDEAYYKKLEENMDLTKISKYGRNFINSYYRSVSAYNRKALKDGVVDLTRLNEADKIGIEDLKTSRTQAKSYYDEVGNLKEGLEKANGEVVPSSTKELSSEAQLAIDLQTFDKGFIRDVEAFEQDYFDKNGRYPSTQEVKEFQKQVEKETDPIFWDLLQKSFERSAEDGMEFLKMNSHINFSSEFWDSLAGSKSLVDRIKEQIERDLNDSPQKAEELKKALKTIEEKGTAMREILKQYRRSGNPSEIATELMSTSAREMVKEIQQSLSYAYQTANRYVESTEQEKKQVETSNEVNMAYHKIIRDMGLENISEENIKNEIEFVKDHMTDINYNDLINAVEFLNRIKRGDTDIAPNKIVARTIEESFPSLTLDSIQGEEFDLIKRKIARDRLLPYYRRFSPSSYEVFNSLLKEGSTDANSVASKIRAVKDGMGGEITITPTRTFLKDSGENNRNPNFVTNNYGGVEQPKKSMFKNQKFEDMFGEIEYADRDDYLSGVSKKNPKLYEAYKVILEWNKVGLDAMGVQEGFNYYTAPQIRKGSIQRMVDLSKNINGRSVKEAYEEMVTFTPDEMVKGETNFGDTIKVIPMQYIRKLRNAGDISTDLFYSIAARNAEGFKRQTRLKHYGDIMSLSDTISKRDTGNGKDVKATNAYKMFESFKDYSLYGIKETWSYEIDTKIFGKVDLARILRKLVQYIKFKNLGLNIIIPITSALTTKVQMSIERAVGEHVDSRSVKMARKEMPKLLTEAMKDFNTIGKTSELTVLGQYFRVFDVGETLKNSSYSGFARILAKTGMGLHGLSNFPLYGEAMMTVLHDYRIIDGALFNKRQFVREMKKKDAGVTKAQIKTAWDANEQDSFRSFISVKDGAVVFDKVGLREKLTNEVGRKMDEAEFETYFEEKLKGVQTRMGEVVLNIDQQIPMETRVAAQRSALWSIFLTHKSFLITNLSRRTRSEFWNPVSGEYEAGTYRSNFNFIGEALSEMRKKGSKNFLKEFSQQWKEASPEQRINLRRSAADISILTLMGIIGYLLFGMADDDDYEDSYGVQATAYFYQRLLNETSSMQLAGTVTTLNETVSSPIVGMQIIEGIFSSTDLFSSEIIETGTYKGETVRKRHLTKMSPLLSNIKYLQDSKSLKQARKNYRLFNAQTIDGNAFTYFANKLEDE